MSITFAPNHAASLALCCDCDGAGFTGDFNLGTDVDCSACAGTGRLEQGVPTANFSNVNAAAVIAALGLADDGEGVGEADAADLLGRALLRAALPASEPVPTVADGNVTTFGRREGYMQDAAAQLAAVAAWARDNGVTVIWY